MTVVKYKISDDEDTTKDYYKVIQGMHHYINYCFSCHHEKYLSIKVFTNLDADLGQTNTISIYHHTNQ